MKKPVQNIFKSERNFCDWMYIKDNIQFTKIARTFKEWEIWWCAIGENVGTEINGKGRNFSRPVIIFKKFNRFSLVAIPLTTKNHVDKYPDRYIYFKFKDKEEYAAIHQIKNISAFRLQRKIRQLDDGDIKKIVEGIKNLYIKNAPSGRGVGGKIPNYKIIIAKIRKFRKCLFNF